MTTITLPRCYHQDYPTIRYQDPAPDRGILLRVDLGYSSEHRVAITVPPWSTFNELGRLIVTSIWTDPDEHFAEFWVPKDPRARLTTDGNWLRPRPHHDNQWADILYCPFGFAPDADIVDAAPAEYLDARDHNVCGNLGPGYKAVMYYDYGDSHEMTLRCLTQLAGPGDLPW